MADLLFGRFVSYHGSHRPSRCIFSKPSIPNLHFSNRLLVPSLASSSSSSDQDSPRNLYIISTTDHSDGSVEFRFGDLTQIQENVQEVDSAIPPELIQEEDYEISERRGLEIVEGVIESNAEESNGVDDQLYDIVSEGVEDSDAGKISVDISEKSFNIEIVIPVDASDGIVLQSDDLTYEQTSDTNGFVSESVVSIEQEVSDTVDATNLAQRGEDADQSNVIEEPPTLSLSDAEPILGEETSYAAVDESVDTNRHEICDIVMTDSLSDTVDATNLDQRDDNADQSNVIEEPPTASLSEAEPVLKELTPYATVDATKLDQRGEDADQSNVIEESSTSSLSDAQPNLREETSYATVDATTLDRMGEDADQSNVIEEPPTSSLSEAEPILREETSYATVDESVDTNGQEICEMNNDNVSSVPSSTAKEDIKDGDIESSTTEQMTTRNLREAQLTSVVSQSEYISTNRFFLSSGAASLPHPSKVLAGGEDAYFVACQHWLGVADGASQWSLEGINEGMFSKELMYNCEKIVSDNSTSVTDPVEVLCRSAAETKSTGLSTVLVAYLDNQTLEVANIGDTGFMIIRDGTVIKKSSPMVHEFNFPCQIKKDDDPSELIEVYHYDLDEDDVIITATNGLFDNLFEQEITSLVSRSLQENWKPQDIAGLLALISQDVGQLTSTRSPFADAAQAAGYVGYRGGKVDDVTVIVSLVRKK